MLKNLEIPLQQVHFNIFQKVTPLEKKFIHHIGIFLNKPLPLICNYAYNCRMH